MNFFYVIILSIVEGITEFLPVSSTGHLVLISHLMGIAEDEFVKTFLIVIQLGAILAAVTLYFNTVMKQKNLIGKTIIAFIPSVIAGFTLYPIIKGVLLENVYITLTALFLGGIAFIALEKLVFEKSSGTKTTLKTLSAKDALIVGAFQALSIIPGVSRAGATIIGGMLTNMNRKSAVEFSFLLAIPTMAGATFLDITETQASFTPENITYLITGMMVSFIVAFVVMKWFVKFIQDNSFVWFGVYRIVFAVLYFLIITL